MRTYQPNPVVQYNLGPIFTFLPPATHVVGGPVPGIAPAVARARALASTLAKTLPGAVARRSQPSRLFFAVPGRVSGVSIRVARVAIPVVMVRLGARRQLSTTVPLVVVVAVPLSVIVGAFVKAWRQGGAVIAFVCLGTRAIPTSLRLGRRRCWRFRGRSFHPVCVGMRMLVCMGTGA